MKIKTNELTTFLKKIQLRNAEAISECILDFQKDGLKINATSSAQQSRVTSWLKTSAFTEYEEI